MALLKISSNNECVKRHRVGLIDSKCHAAARCLLKQGRHWGISSSPTLCLLVPTAGFPQLTPHRVRAILPYDNANLLIAIKEDVGAGFDLP